MKDKKRIIAIIAVIILLIILLLILLLKGKQYTVSFDTNDGSEITSIKVKENNKIEKPEDPKMDGYIFIGWYYNDELFDFETPVKQDMTLKAEWEEKSAEIEGVTLNATELNLAPDGIALLVATLLPENAKPTKLIWSSSNENIVKIDENGNIQAVSEGEATVTVTTEDGGYTASCTITVTRDNVAVTGVTISGSTEVNVGSTIKLTAKVMPEDATNKQIMWSSSNRNIATVDSNGNVKGKREGKVIITVITVDGAYKQTYTILVKANTQSSNPTEPSKEPTQPSNPTEPSKEPTQPSNPTQPSKEPTKPNNPTEPSKEPTKPDNPTQPSKEPSKVSVTGVTLTGASEVNVKSSITLTANVQPSNATNKNVTWSSSNPSVASVNNGVVTGISEGETTITVTTEDGSYTATHKVTVKSVYIITFTDEADEDSKKFGMNKWRITVTKDGSTFTGYDSITYNGRTQEFKSSQYVNKDWINTTVKNATINIGSKSVPVKTINYN